MEPTTSVNGLMTSSMVMVRNPGPMVQSMKETTSTAKKKAREGLLSQMAVSTRESFNKMRSVDSESTPGLMAKCMKENGVTTKCMEKEK